MTASWPLHRNERPIFQIMGKPYLWVRVNGILEIRPAVRDGQLTAEAIDRVADGK